MGSNQENSIPLWYPKILSMKKVLFLLSILCPSYIQAQWNSNPSINTPVCIATGDQPGSEIVADNTGGVFIVWEDRRSGNSNPDIYLQHLDSSGVALLTANGIPVCTATGAQGIPQIVTDGAGGCFVFWADGRAVTTTTLYAQHYNASGTALWAVDGIGLISSPSNYKVVADNNGGAVVSWTINGTGTGADVMAQRMDNTGNLVWTSGGVLLCNAINDQSPFGLVVQTDGSTVVAWIDSRNSNGSNGNTDLFAQKVSASGNILWTSNGTGICQESHTQNVAEIISAQDNGVIVSWQDGRISGSQPRTYVQHLDSAGNKLWAADGLSLGTTPHNIPVLATDNTGGAIVAWYDARNFTNITLRNNDIYAQRVNAAGVAQWTSGGQMVCNDSFEQAFPRIVNDGGNGAVLVWLERPETIKDLRAQRIDGSGNTVWTSPATICNASGYISNPRLARSGNKIIVTWSDNRSGNFDIYAARLNLIGTNPIPLPVDIISFSGEEKGNMNLLTWITASETNNKGFAIERSSNATHFAEIGFVKGQGTTSTAATYHFTDEQPFTGKNFYRLKQTDMDGKSKYSAVIELINKRDAAAFLYPNPAGDEIKVITDQKEQVYIIDIYGRNVLSSFTNQSVNITSLKPGRYYCRLGATVLSFVKK